MNCARTLVVIGKGWLRAWLVALLAPLPLGACSSVLERHSVAPAQAPGSLETRVGARSDDAEESAEGKVNLKSDDLELTFDEGEQLIGVRFRGVTVPPGATVKQAYLEFEADEDDGGEAVLELRAHDTNDAPTFSNGNGDLSERKLTRAAVRWQPEAWEGGEVARTPDLAAVIQEVVGREGWRSGNALALVISGSGRRTAKAYDSGSENAPRLHLSYSRPGASAPAPSRPGDAELGQLRAFPGAEGFGSDTPGGRGGRVLFVTNLNDAGPGSLRAAVEASGPRTVLFAVGGTITLRSELEVSDPYLTIAGHSAPGDGVSLRGDGGDFTLMKIRTHDVVVRYLRFRKGPGGGKDNLTLESGARRVMIDHNSFSWATDENINSYRDVSEVTFSWNLIAEPLHCSTHEEGCHGKNGAMGKYQTGSQSFHHNLLMSAHDRSLQLNQAYGVADYVNNVHYNNYDMTYLRGDHIGEDRRGSFVGLNFVGNYYAYGPDSKQRGDTKPELRLKGAGPDKMQVYARGNLGPSRSSEGQPEWDIVDEWDKSYRAEERFAAPAVRTTSARQAYEEVLAQAGANLPRRDLVDARLVAEVRRGQGQWVDHPNEVGGWPPLRSGELSPDGDGDGMADSWEVVHGLSDAKRDHSGDRDGDGYTNLEEFLASLEN